MAVPELLHNVAEEEVDVPELAAVVVTGAAVVVTGAAVVVTGAAVVVTGAAVVVGVPELDVEPQGWPFRVNEVAGEMVPVSVPWKPNEVDCPAESEPL